MAPPAVSPAFSDVFGKWASSLVAGKAHFLWYLAPLAIALAYLLTRNAWAGHHRRRLREIDRWIDDFLGPLPPVDAAAGRSRRKRSPARRVHHIPSRFGALVDEVAPGAHVADVVLVPEKAYAVIGCAGAATSVDHQTVVFELATPAPAFTIRPVPVVDGKPVLGRGITFPDDADFARRVVVEGVRPNDIRAWLGPALREAIAELPGAWVQCRGSLMSVTLYGSLEAERLDELVGLADAFWAEAGADAEVSLFGPEEPAARRKPAAPVPTQAPLLARLQAGLIDQGLYLVGAAAILATIYFGSDVRPGTDPLDHILGAPPAPDGSGPWNGGWTPGGFGWFVLAETLFVGLFVAQAFLGSRGSSIGKALLKMRVLGPDGRRPTFVRDVLVRSWMWWLIPGGGAAAFFAYRATGGIPRIDQLLPALASQPLVLAVVFAVLLVDLLVGAARTDRRCLHDLVAGTRVVVLQEPVKAAPSKSSRALTDAPPKKKKGSGGAKLETSTAKT